MSHLLVFIQSTIQVVKGRNSYESNEFQMLRVSLLPWSIQMHNMPLYVLPGYGRFKSAYNAKSLIKESKERHKRK